MRGPAGAACCELRVADIQWDPLLADGVVLDCIAMAPGDANKTLAKTTQRCWEDRHVEEMKHGLCFELVGACLKTKLKTCEHAAYARSRVIGGAWTQQG